MQPKSYKAELKETEDTTPDTRIFTFEYLGEAPGGFKPGQHIYIVAEREGKKKANAYSFTSLPEELPRFELVIKTYPEGFVSRSMHELRVGDTIEAYEPMGELYLRRTDVSPVFIATGTGITPMISMLKQFLKEAAPPLPVHLFLGVKTEQDIIYGERLRRLEAEGENFSFVVSLDHASEAWEGRRGFIQTHLEDVLGDLSGRDYYVCGVPPMVIETKKHLGQLGVPAERVFSEGWEEASLKPSSKG